MDTKSEILFLLEKNRGGFLSGEEIAAELGITRSSVWKAIHSLEARGVAIQAVKNRGYKLSEYCDSLTAEAISANLPNSCTNCEILVFDSVDSTNNEARRYAAAGAKHGTLIVANEQTDGRGRQGRSFFSPPDTGLYMSMILRPWAGITHPQLITVAAAVSVCHAIERQNNLTPEIKWVNDILLDGKKVCGILTEAVTSMESASIEQIIVGIGINCKNPKENFPKELSGIATALETPELRRSLLCAEIAGGIVEFFEKLDSAELLEEYRARCNMTGKSVSFIHEGEKQIAIVRGIDAECKLELELENGDSLTLASGEVRLINIT